MGYHRRRQSYDDNTSDYPCAGFLLTHVLGSMFIFYMGMRFALKRAPLLPVLIYRLMRGTAHR
jgi:hypothetical protein